MILSLYDFSKSCITINVWCNTVLNQTVYVYGTNTSNSFKKSLRVQNLVRMTGPRSRAAQEIS